MTRSRRAVLEAKIRVLQARLNAYEAPEPDCLPEWAIGLTRQQLDMIYLLAKAKGRVLTHDYLDANIRHFDPKADRDPGIVKTTVCKVRKHLGFDVIDTVPEHGYRATPKLMDIVGRKPA